jgi:hypothetical protein
MAKSVAAPMNVVQNLLMVVRQPGVIVRPRRYVLVLSHMRSYSSLFCHILGSHPEVDGYAEMHQSYRGRVDLLRLNARVYRSLDGELAGRFVLDKLLHNSYGVSGAVLERPTVYPIFLVRDPADSLASIIEMGKRIPSVAWYSDAGLVTDYYEGRLRHLVRSAETLEKSFFFLRAEQLIGDTRLSLDSIGCFLGLGSRLAESYSLFKNTGRQGWGDDSNTILQGRIVRDSQQRIPAVEERFLLRARTAYDDCCRVLEGTGVCPTPCLDDPNPCETSKTA